MASRRARILRWAAATAAAFVALAAIVPLAVDVDRFRPALERRLGSAIGAPVRLGKLRLTLWTGPGVVAEGISISPSGPESTGFDAPRFEARLAVLPLLHGVVDARRVALRGGTLSRGGRRRAHGLDLDAKVAWGSGGSGPAASGRVAADLDALPGSPRAIITFDGRLDGDRLALSRFGVEIGRARFDGSGRAEGFRSGVPHGELRARVRYLDTRAEGNVSFEAPPDGLSLTFDLAAELADFDAIGALLSGEGSPPRAGGFSVAYAAPPAATPDRAGFLSRVRGTGRLSAARARWEGLEVERFSSDVRLASGSARLENAAFEAYGGRGSGSLDTRLIEPAVPFTLSTRLEGVQVQPVLAAFSRDLGAVVEGTGSVAADLDGVARGDLARSLRGTTRVKVERGKLRSIGLMKQVARVLELAGGRGIGKDETPFERASATFAVRDGVARTDDLQFRSHDLDLDGGGSVAVDGALAFDVVSTFSREATSDLLKRTPQLRFRVGEDGRLSVPMQVRGSAKAPTVQLDLDRVLREGLRRELKNEGAKGLLKRLLGK